MDAMTFKDFITILTPILFFVLSLAVGVVGFFVKGLINEMKGRINHLERDLSELKAVLPRQYVIKDDYIRTISVFEQKLDDIRDNIIKLIQRENGNGAESRL